MILFELNQIVEELQNATNICKLYTVGNFSKSIKENMKSQYNDNLTLNADMIVLDRSVDLTTCMLTQLSYRGLMDELELSDRSETKYYSFLYDLNFSHIPNMLKNEVSGLNTQYESRHDAKSVDQIKSFVGKLGNLQTKHKQLSQHTNISETINAHIKENEFQEILRAEQSILSNNEEEATETINELIYSECKVDKVIRLIILQCLVYGGLKTATIDNYATLICQTYGYQHMITFLNLEETNILKKRSKILSTFFELDAIFDLNTVSKIDEEDNNRNIEKIDSIYSGYVPLTTRLIQISLGEFEYNPKTTLNLISGFTKKLAFGNQAPQLNQPKWTQMQQQIDLIGKEHTYETFEEIEQEPDIMIVLFVGGCTYSEISLIRLVGKLYQKHMIVVTTGIITGSNITRGFFET